MLRALATLLMVWVVGLLPAGCRRDPTAASGRRGHETIVLVGSSQKDPAWPIIRAGFLAFGKDFVTTPLQAVAPSQESPSEQIRLLEQAADQHVAGVCLMVTDVEAMTHIIDRLFLQGISVITVHHDAAESQRTAFVGVDQFAVGEAIADALAQGLADRQNIMLLHSGTDDSTFGPRYYGFKRRLARHYPHIALLREFDCQGSPFEAEDIVREQMARYPRLGGWAVLGDWPLRYLQGKPPLVTPGCLVVGYGPYPQFWPLIENGTCHAMVGADYFEMGYQAASYCRQAILRSPSLPEYNRVPVEQVTFSELLDYRKKWQHWLAAGQQTTEQ